MTARAGPVDGHRGDPVRDTDGSTAPTTSVPDGLRILFICTANQCRSPLAEVLAVEQLRRRGIRADVSSAGFLSGGAEAAAGSQHAARRMGLSLAAHRSRRVTPEIVDEADVIITMEPDHVVRLFDEAQGSRDRTVTLKELARRARTDRSATGPLSATDPERTVSAISTWVRSATDRDLRTLLMADNTVVDPMGRSKRSFRRTADEIDGLLSDIFELWFGPVHG